jgi:hypothetical protein
LSFPPGNTPVVSLPLWSATAGLSEGCQDASLAVALTGTTTGTSP